MRFETVQVKKQLEVSTSDQFQENLIVYPHNIEGFLPPSQVKLLGHSFKNKANNRKEKLNIAVIADNIICIKMFTLTSTYGECTVDLFTLRLEVVGVVGAPLLGLNVQAMTVNAIDGMKYSYLICTNIKRWNE